MPQADAVDAIVEKYVVDPAQRARVATALRDPSLSRLARVTIMLCTFGIDVRGAAWLAGKLDDAAGA